MVWGRPGPATLCVWLLLLDAGSLSLGPAAASLPLERWVGSQTGRRVLPGQLLLVPASGWPAALLSGAETSGKISLLVSPSESLPQKSSFSALLSEPKLSPTALGSWSCPSSSPVGRLELTRPSPGGSKLTFSE